MPFQKSFDEILNGLLADHQSQDPAADISKGSLICMKSAAKASAFWSLYAQLNVTTGQIFPDSDICSLSNLQHHATVRGLVLVPGESKAELLARYLDHIRRPPAGGNKYDYARWAKEIPGVGRAWPVSGGQGPGTTDLVILADAELTGSEIPTVELLAEVRAHIVDICPNDVKYLRALAPEVLIQHVDISRSGAPYPAARAQQEITLYMQQFLPGQALYLGQLTSLALGGGEGDAVCSVPSANVVPTGYQMIRPGVVSVL
jgi:uncharacterized phage protein gp47/JayE